MSLLDTASLIVTPNGYKEGKLYSVIPSDGSGDLSVTRATTATRVNSAGLVELVPYNLLSWSEDFSSTRGFFANVVGSSTAVFTANYATAPNGTTTADRIQLALNGQPYADWVQPQSLPLVTGNTYTYSIYLKSLSGSATLMIFNDGVGNITKTITTEWQRYDYTWTATTGSVFPRFLLQAGTSLSADLVAWGYQINEGTIKDYQKTETRLNIPRLDYSNGTCPSILVEPQRTNRLFYSEKLLLGYAFAYTSGTFTVTENTTETLDPFGNYNAEKFNATTQSNNDSYTSTSGSGNLTLSIFAKKGTNDSIQLYHDNVLSGGAFSATFNLTSGTITASSGTASIQDLGNGWFRCSVSGTDSNSAGNIHGVTTYTGTTYLFGIQLEQGNYVTSYIPTTSASVTRNADVISKTGISSLIGQTEGAVMIDINIDSSFAKSDMRFIDVSDDSIANWYFIGTNAANEIRFYFRSSNTAYVSVTTTLTNGRHKLAFAYKNNDYVAYVDGVQVHSTTTLAVGSTSKVTLGNDFGGFNPSKQFINAAALWKTRLTNAQLATLTTI